MSVCMHARLFLLREHKIIHIERLSLENILFSREYSIIEILFFDAKANYW